MALIMMDMRRYDKRPNINARDINDPRLSHGIGKRPVISDTLSLGEKLDKALSGMQANAPKVYYNAVGWSETEADEFTEAAETKQNQFMLTSPFQQRTETQAPVDPNATPQDAYDIKQNGAVNPTDLLEADKLLMTA